MPSKSFDDFRENLPVTDEVVARHRESKSVLYGALRSGISEVTGEPCDHGNTFGHIRARWDRLNDEQAIQLHALFALLFPST